MVQPISVQRISEDYWRTRPAPGIWTPHEGSRQVASGEVLARLWPQVERSLANHVVPELGTPAWCALDAVADRDAYHAAIWWAAINWSIYVDAGQAALAESTANVAAICGRHIQAAHRTNRNIAEYNRAHPDLVRRTQ